jgi:hypothetical protein
MKAIKTKYLCATNFRGSRLSVTTGEPGQRIVMGWPDELNSSKAHAKGARALADKMGWQGKLIGGGFPDGTMVWVFDNSFDVA